MKKRSKAISRLLILSFLVGALPLGAIVPLAAGNDASADLILKENKEMRLWYDEPAADDDGRTWDHNKAKNSGWETEALNIGIKKPVISRKPLIIGLPPKPKSVRNIIFPVT